MNASAFPDLWARVIFENITSNHKSRNETGSSCDFFVYYILNKITLLRYFACLGCTLLEKLFIGFQTARMFYLNRSYINCDGQTKPINMFYST